MAPAPESQDLASSGPSNHTGFHSNTLHAVHRRRHSRILVYQGSPGAVVVSSAVHNTMTKSFRSSRLAQINPKATNALAERMPELLARGLRVINLATARPDFDTPGPIKAAAQAALDVPVTYILYSDSRGLIELREAVAGKLATENGLAVDPRRELLITAGTHEALTVALLATVDPGDEVIIFDPSWVAYQGMIRLAGGVPVFVPLTSTRLDPERLVAALSPQTRAILFTNPNNPTGTVFTPEELEAIATIACEHDLLVMVDEIYEYFLYDGRSHHSIASLPSMRERTITINGVSKAYAMTGWRIGYAAASPNLIEAMVTVHQHVISAPCTFAQKGAVAAFEGAKEAYRPMVEAYARRRDALAAGLASIETLRAPLPEGACFFFVEVDSPLTSAELSEVFLERGGLMLTPGSAFGPSSEGRLRLSFASISETQIQEVLIRLRAVVTELERAPERRP
jgi:aspartate aminotransferase